MTTKHSGTREPKQNGTKVLADVASEALEAFRAEAPEAYGELVKAYEDHAAIVGVFGVGSVTVAVQGGKVYVNPEKGVAGAKAVGRGAVYPETIAAIASGEMTILDAFHRGELIARAESSQLHRAYGFAVKFSDVALRSKRLQETFRVFREKTGS
jgi:hypothetical protein